MKTHREITVTVLIPEPQEGPLAASLAALKLTEEQFVQTLVAYGLLKAEEGVFDGTMNAADALVMNSGYGRQVRDRIGRLMQVAEKALVEQQALIIAARVQMTKKSASETRVA